MFWLESGPLNAQTTNIVYLCRPQVKWMKVIAGGVASPCTLYFFSEIRSIGIVDQIKQLGAGSSPHTYNLILVPRRTTLCDRVLEEEGVFGEITISNYKLEFIPLEDDLLSLEWESTYKEIFLVRASPLYLFPNNADESSCARLHRYRMEMKPPYTTQLRLCLPFNRRTAYSLGLSEREMGLRYLSSRRYSISSVHRRFEIHRNLRTSLSTFVLTQPTLRKPNTQTYKPSPRFSTA